MFLKTMFALIEVEKKTFYKIKIRICTLLNLACLCHMIACFIIIAAHVLTFYLILKTAVEKAENTSSIRLKILNYFIENIVRKEAYLQKVVCRKFITRVFSV